MSLYLAVELNDEVKKLISVQQTKIKQISDGEYEDPTRFHITVRFLQEDEENVNLAMKGLELFKKKYDPKKFEVKAKDFHKFEQGVAWIGLDNSMPLYEMKYQIEECLKEVGFPLKKDKFKGYTPHITMAYDIENSDFLNVKFEEIPITVDNLSLWTGFKANDVYIHNSPYRVDFK